MPSRKRNKGRQRKARAARRDVESSTPRPLPSASHNLQTLPPGVCNHSADQIDEMMTPEDRKRVNDYLLLFKQRLREFSENEENVTSSQVGEGGQGRTSSAHYHTFKLTHALQPEILGDANLREALKWRFLRGATAAMVEEDHSEAQLMALGGCGVAVVIIESFDENSNELDIHDDVCWKHRYVFNGCRRSIVKFFAKRIPCKCLDGLLSEVQSQPKTGLCFTCSEKKDLRELMVCNGCKVADYCSVECQESDWPQHQKHCKKYRALHSKK
ncbi:hypothetical protein ACHAWF_011345 [Thalassiosira exigua]